MAHFGLPYRPPCGGWPATPKVSKGCYQHTRASESHFQHWLNATLESDGSVPSARSDRDWLPTDFLPCSADDATHKQVGFNCYVLQDGIFDNLSRCRKVGFKNVQASKNWHGRPGFFAGDGTQQYTPLPTPGADCATADLAPGQCLYTPPEPTVPNVKYRSVSRSASITTTVLNADGSGSTSSYEVGWSNSVDKFGVMTQDSATAGYCAAVSGSNINNVNLLTLAGLDHNNAGWVPVSWMAITTGFTYWWIAMLKAAEGGAYTCDGHNSDMTNRWHLSVGTSVSDTDISFDYTYVLEQWGPTVEHPDILSLGSTSTTVQSMTAHLGSAYSGTEVQTDIAALLNHIPLNDDAAYQWRTDGAVSVAPLLAYNEYASRSPEGALACGYVDPLAGTLGGVIGLPNPVGYDAYFDPQHLEGSNRGYFTPLYLPPQFTRWTPDTLAANLWPGAWLWFDTGSQSLLGQKWAEIKIHRPALDLFGPCGRQRFLADQLTVRCVTAVDGLDLTLAALGTDQPPIKDGELCVVNDGTHSGVYPVTRHSDTSYTLGARLWELPDDAAPGVAQIGRVRWPGAWSICGHVAVASAAVAAGTVTVTLGAPAKYLRSGDAVDFTDGSDSVTDADKTVTVIDETHFSYPGSSGPTGAWVKAHGAPAFWWYDTDSKGDYLVLEWRHNFRDIGEADMLCAQWAANHSVCHGWYDSFDDSGCDGGSSTLRSLQASRGMPRSVAGITATPGCLPFNPCWPQVVCISPNGETWEDGKTYGFPGGTSADSIDITADSVTVTVDAGLLLDWRYGTLWQSAPLFVMQDPFYQTPSAPCASSSWSPDAGGDCSGNYAHAPMVEARNSVPNAWIDGDTAPTLPSDVTLHILTIDDLNATIEPNGVVQAPPALTDVPQWVLWKNQIQCVCRSDAFAEEYKANEVTTKKCP